MKEKELLRQFLYRGNLNVEQAEHLKTEMMVACSLDVNSNKDRAVWSNWINCRSTPNRWCKEHINNVAQQHGYNPIYE